MRCPYALKVLGSTPAGWDFFFFVVVFLFCFFLKNTCMERFAASIYWEITSHLTVILKKLESTSLFEIITS